MSRDAATDQQENTSTTDSKATTPTIDEAIEQAKRAFALKQYEKAVEHYATALELSTAKYGDRAPESADLLLEYGKALLENAVCQSAVLGKDEEKEEQDDNEAPTDPRFKFEGEIEGDEDEEGVHLSNLPDDDEEEGGQEGPEDQDDEDAPEDDFNAAWEVLELARMLYDTRKDEDDEIKLKLADTYLALGDVSTETEKFEQAIEDYAHAVDLKMEVLPYSSRQIAEAHLKLSLVLDITSGRLADAIRHVEQSVESVEARLSELRQGPVPLPNGDGSGGSSSSKCDVKGKGKARKLVRDPIVANMTPEEIEAEVKDLEGMKEELLLKLEEIRTAPEAEGTVETTDSSSGARLTAPERAARALDKDLKTGQANSEVQVNDLTGVVKKKKKKGDQDGEEVPVDAEEAVSSANGLKRKVDDEEREQSEDSKRAKLAEDTGVVV